jgi:hypothetical protein
MDASPDCPGFQCCVGHPLCPLGDGRPGPRRTLAFARAWLLLPGAMTSRRFATSLLSRWRREISTFWTQDLARCSACHVSAKAIASRLKAWPRAASPAPSGAEPWASYDFFSALRHSLMNFFHSSPLSAFAVASFLDAMPPPEIRTQVLRGSDTWTPHEPSTRYHSGDQWDQAKADARRASRTERRGEGHETTGKRKLREVREVRDRLPPLP